MIPPRGAKPSQRPLHALAERGRFAGALALAEERHAQGLAIVRSQLAQDRERNLLELGGHGALLLVGALVGERAQRRRARLAPALSLPAQGEALVAGDPDDPGQRVAL